MRPIAAQLHQGTLTFRVILWTYCLLLLLPLVAWGQPYALTWSAHTAGGGRAADGGYALVGAIGCFGETDLQMADTDARFTLQYQGNGQIRIGYSTIRGDAPRSIALTVDLGSATVQSPADVLTKDPAFNGFLDYAHTYPAGYVLGAGHPLANASGPGVPNFGTGLGQFAINVACFDETANQSAGPMSSTNLITLQLHGSGPTTVTLDADLTRGGSYMAGGQTVNLPVWLNVTLP
jgi:hypothetical protein